MVRSFLVNLADSVTPVVLLAPGLFMCVACATPFPVGELQEGMTTEAVRTNFGEPEAIETEQGGVESWWYVDERPTWAWVLPHTIVFIPLFAAIPDTSWDSFYVNRRPIQLDFRAEKLVRWNLGRFPVANSDPNMTLFGLDYDAQHHAKGHKHHHGH